MQEYLQEPGYTSTITYVEMRKTNEYQIIDFRICDESPWSLEKENFYLFINF